jgi:leader peptidase (prepilin peptidase)/N-methyltransferase
MRSRPADGLGKPLSTAGRPAGGAACAKVAAMSADRRPAPPVGVSSPRARDHATAGWSPRLLLATGILCALTAWRFGLAWELPAFLVLAAVAVPLTVVDLRHRLLPNRLLGPASVAGAGLLSLAAAVTGDWTSLVRALLGAVVLFAGYLVLALLSPRSLGMGDVKLAGLLGLFLGWLGWGAVVVGAAAGFAVQALVALVLLAGRRIGLRSELPFGPAMLLGAALAIAGGDLLLR